MRLLIDEMFSSDVVDRLRAAGHDAVGVRDLGLASKEDATVLGRAALDDRVVVTENAADFVPPERQPRFCAVVVGLGRRQPTTSAQDRSRWQAGGVTATDPACALAHDDHPSDDLGTLVAVFASPVARWLLHFGRHTGYRTVLIEPGPDVDHRVGPYADDVYGDFVAAKLDDTAAVVVTDHHRDELGELVRDALATPAHWIGVMGSPRHIPPHIERLRELGTSEDDIARVHRPIGLNIGSKTPPEIAVATLAGLIAERRGRPGGFEFLS